MTAIKSTQTRKAKLCLLALPFLGLLGFAVPAAHADDHHHRDRHDGRHYDRHHGRHFRHTEHRQRYRRYFRRHGRRYYYYTTDPYYYGAPPAGVSFHIVL